MGARPLGETWPVKEKNLFHPVLQWHNLEDSKPLSCFLWGLGVGASELAKDGTDNPCVQRGSKGGKAGAYLNCIHVRVRTHTRAEKLLQPRYHRGRTCTQSIKLKASPAPITSESVGQLVAIRTH